MTQIDLPALHAALDVQRQHRAMSWRDVGRETGLSASTFTRFRDGEGLGLQGYVACCAWLGVSLDRFTSNTHDQPDLNTEVVLLLRAHHVPPAYWRSISELINQLATRPDQVIHRCPDQGGGTTPCCGRIPIELSRTAGLTLNDALVTCKGRT